MISALLLSVALAGARADSASAAPVATDDPAVQLWINNDRRFLAGDDAKVQVRTRDDGYLLVLHVDTEGHLRVLFPLDPKDDDFVRGGRKYEIRGRGGRESFTADAHVGRGTVYAGVSSDPYKFDGYVVGDHWDYRALAPTRLGSDPEADLNDLVRRMSQDDFDYDLLTYDVLEQVAYSSYSTPYYSSGYYDSCFSCGYGPYRSGLSIGLFFGRPYRRAYDPYFPAYYPFYDPFFYDPYYYSGFHSPFYYPRVYRPAYYNPYPHNYGFYNTPRGRFNVPYRFRGNDAVLTGYRGRGFGQLRSINTVYVPPRSRVIQPTASSVARRLSAQPHQVGTPVAIPAARRNGQRVDSRPVSPDQHTQGAASGGRQPATRDVQARPSRGTDGRRNATATGSRQESMPQDVSPRRNVTPRDADPRDATPRDVTPRRAEIDRPQVERAPVAERAPVSAPREQAPEARPSRREEPVRSAPPPSDNRSPRSSGGSGGGGDRGGGGRSVAPSAPSWSGGGGSGGGQAPSGGGGGRRR